MTHRAAQLYLGGGAAEVDVPLRKQNGYLGGIDAAWRGAAAAGREREHQQHRAGLGGVRDGGDGVTELGGR